MKVYNKIWRGEGFISNYHYDNHPEYLPRHVYMITPSKFKVKGRFDEIKLDILKQIKIDMNIDYPICINEFLMKVEPTKKSLKNFIKNFFEKEERYYRYIEYKPRPKGKEE